jgi:thiol-disulfide isomerase/thioredoxin
MKTTKLTLALLLAVVLAAGALGLAACGSDSSEAPADTGTETPAAGTIEILTPDQFDVADYAGRPLVVNFFGSWCAPCNSEAPALAQFASGATDFQVVGIAVNDTESDAVAFMEEYGLDYPLVIDDNSLGVDYRITGVPTTIFFDSRGQEKDRIVGAAGIEQFTGSLAKAQ